MKTRPRIYFDNAATTPVDPRVLEAMQPYFSEKFGNPSSLHQAGQEARAAVEAARETVARFIGAAAEEIIFTSGGSESDNFALKGLAEIPENQGGHIITSTIEHHAVLETADYLKSRGFSLTVLPVDKFGMVNPNDLKIAITPKTFLISVMHANNEIGTIQPIAEIGKIARDRKILLHTDAVQTLGHIPVNVDELGVDLLSASGHKLYGPKGVGFLYLRKGIKIVPLLHGGGQERHLRASTLNVPGIVGLGRAADLAAQKMAGEEIQQVKWRDRIIKEITEKIPEIYLNGHPVKRLPNNISFSVKYVEGEALLLKLDLEGIASSTGSACSSGLLEPSHVLLASGLSPELCHGSLRFSLGRFNKEEEIEYLLEVFPEIVNNLRHMSPLSKK